MQRFIASYDWVGALPAPVRERVEARYVLADLPAGGDICLAEDAPRHAFKILSGYARLTRLRENGQRAIVAIYAPGHCFAERAIIAQRPLNHTTTALVDTRVAMLPRRDFLELYATHSEIPQALCQGFSQIIGQQASAREFDSAFKLRARIIRAFAELACGCGARRQGDYVAVDLPLTQFDLADLLDVTRQSVQIELAALRAAGAVFKRSGAWWVRSPRQ